MSKKQKYNPLTVAITLVSVALVILAAISVITLPEVSQHLKSVLDTVFDPPATDILPENDIEVNVRIDGNVVADEFAEKAIIAYFKLFYAAIGSGESENLDRVYEHESIDSLYDTAVMENLAAGSRTSKLLFERCDVQLNVTSAYTDNKIAEVQLVENVIFDYGEFSSSIYQINHVFQFTQYSERFLIKSHSCDSEFYRLIRNLSADRANRSGYSLDELTYSYLHTYVDEAAALVAPQKRVFGEPSAEDAEKIDVAENDYNIAESDKVDEKIGASESENVTGNSDKENDSNGITQLCEYAYARNAAVHYANSWVSAAAELRNKSMYGVYAENSTNYVSQCLVAGTIPMDTQGDDEFTQWKWYSSNFSLRRTASGCTRSFSEGEYFYQYCRQNRGFGLAADCDIAASEVELGDVVQFLTSGKVNGSAIVTAIYQNGNGERILLVNKNSSDLQTFPVTLIPCDTVRFIKINGYNTVTEEFASNSDE